MVEAFNESRPLAQTSFYEAYYVYVMRRVQEEIGTLPSAEDLVNDIFVEMFSKNRAFVTQKNIENYLDDVIETKCRDYKKRRQTPVIKMDQVLEFNQRIEERAIYLAEIKWTVQALCDMAMSLLPPQCRDIFILYHIRGFRRREIAQLLNISEKTVDRHIDIAWTKLRMEIKKDNGRMYLIQILLPLLWAQLNP